VEIRRSGRRGPGAVVAMALAVLLSGCGDDPVQVEFEVIEEVTFDPSLGIDLSMMTKTNTGVYIEELVVGTGAQLTFGMIAEVDYTGWLKDGTKFDSSLDPGRVPYTFLMGNGEVIAGWEDGMVGMYVGGSRKLVIPAERAYGAQGSSGGVIPPGAIVVFEVTLLSAN